MEQFYLTRGQQVAHPTLAVIWVFPLFQAAWKIFIQAAWNAVGRVVREVKTIKPTCRGSFCIFRHCRRGKGRCV